MDTAELPRIITDIIGYWGDFKKAALALDGIIFFSFYSASYIRYQAFKNSSLVDRIVDWYTEICLLLPGDSCKCANNK